MSAHLNPVRTVVFSHGQRSEPWGNKILAMAGIAKQLGFAVESIDYRCTDGHPDEPRQRVAMLARYCKTLEVPPILVGSSLGGHVAAAVSREVGAHALFLLAPAFYMPGYEQYTPEPAQCPITIVHGWHDDIVPVDNSIRFSREYRATLHVLDGDHRLQENIRQINSLFADFLKAYKSP